MKWEVKGKLKVKSEKLKAEEIVDVLLKNRGIRTKKQREEFFKPKKPQDISLREVGIKKGEVNKAIKRIKKAKKNGEHVIVFGDYDADGVCATAILWETLHALDLSALPYIPDRFKEGYGISVDSIKKLATRNPQPTLIITVDNGIVASDAVGEANKLGIDVIVTDHHESGKKLPKAHSIIHTQEIGGAGVAWMFAKEIRKKFQIPNSKFQNGLGLDLAAIGTVTDQIPLLGVNRLFVKYGLEKLRKTKRLGLLELYKEAAIKLEDINTYHINYVIAPRINAMGRLEHAIDSLRLLCTTNKKRAGELSSLLGSTNKKRQKVVEEVVLHAEKQAGKKEWKGAILLAHESYHEGVIGLAASRLVEKYYRPSIVFSKGKKLSKASARSISGFNIIEAIRELENFLHAGGGHPMAAGFTVETKRLKEFIVKFEKLSSDLLTNEILTKSLKVDLELDFKSISWGLLSSLKKFEPTGRGNYTPVFTTSDVSVLNCRTVGMEAKHLKLKLEKNGKVFDAIAFGMGDKYMKVKKATKFDAAYSLEENVWNGRKSIQIKLKDLKIE